MPPTANPPVRLSAAPSSGLLAEKDGREFSALLQGGRLAANMIGNYYPNISEPNALTAAYSSQPGQIVLAHLSAVMYSYWDQAPSGPSAHELAMKHCKQPLREVCRTECAAWGKRRLNAPIGETLFVVMDTPEGSVIADHTMAKFYKVLGLKRSPAATLTRIGASLPAAVRLTALPFRGVLVYDGIMGGDQPRSVSARNADKLRLGYAQAQRNGKVITGFHVESCSAALKRTPEGEAAASCETSDRAIGDLSSEEKKQVDALKAVRKEDGMLVFRRLGYTEKENPMHAVAIMNGSTASGSFTSAALVPSTAEVLREIVKLGRSSGVLPRFVAVDDSTVATAVNSVTTLADIRTGYYPAPSLEEQALLTALPPGILEALRGFNGSVF